MILIIPLVLIIALALAILHFVELLVFSRADRSWSLLGLQRRHR
jgi:hypothetical protein